MRIGLLGPFSYRDNADYGSEMQVGAIEQQLFGLGQELAKLGHEVYISRTWGGYAGLDTLGGVHLVNVEAFPTTWPSFQSLVHPLGQIGLFEYVLRSPKRLVGLGLDVLVV